MRITILALGSLGDVVPCLTLGQALQRAGHQVRFATFENFEALVSAHGLAFTPIRGDMQRIMSGAGGQELSASGQNTARFAWSVFKLFGTMAANFAEDLSAPELDDSDLIINQLPGGLYGYDLAEKLGVPMLLAAVMPLTPSRHEPMLAFPSLFASLPGYNAFTHWLAYQLVWQGFRPAVNRWRKRRLGLSSAPLFGYSRSMQEQRVPVLNGFSTHAVERPPDWGEHIHITGAWLPVEPEWTPPDDLLRFLDAGPPPVFVGFGSMTMRHPQRTTAIVLEALQRTGLRAILHMGWGDLGGAELPEHIHRIAYAPYGWLFPQMAAVVHHGGSGTTAFGLQAGVPSIIVPFLFDQFFWGERVAALGVGPAPIPHRKLSVERLSEALTSAVNDHDMRQRAAELGKKVRSENGVRAALDVIEAYT